MVDIRIGHYKSYISPILIVLRSIFGADQVQPIEGVRSEIHIHGRHALTIYDGYINFTRMSRKLVNFIIRFFNVRYYRINETIVKGIQVDDHLTLLPLNYDNFHCYDNQGKYMMTLQYTGVDNRYLMRNIDPSVTPIRQVALRLRLMRRHYAIAN